MRPTVGKRSISTPLESVWKYCGKSGAQFHDAVGVNTCRNPSMGPTRTGNIP